MKEYNGSIAYSLSLVNVAIATFSLLTFVATTKPWPYITAYVAVSYAWFLIQTKISIK